jgi:tetratricopeptide (TPR) repeat protein
MARFFISHSSKNNFAAIALRDWIMDGGWDDHPFLDLDPERGIAAGERWERALHEAADRCEVALFLISRDWLRSDWCVKEFTLAQKLNKRPIGVLIDDLPLTELPPALPRDWEVVNLAAGSDHELFRVTSPNLSKEEHVTFSRSGLARLKAGLDRAGLDPRFFKWPPENEPERAPYRGLEALDSVDAGIFFGRDAPIVAALDALRGLREGAAPRIFVLLGASGSGKSSFLRAGLLPRLDRDDRNFLPLRVIRPELAAWNGSHGFIESLSAACLSAGLTTSLADIRQRADQGANALRPVLNEIVQRAARLTGASKPPTLILAIDQAEELFRAEGVQESDRLLAFVHDLAALDDPAAIVVFSIRTDSYDALERATRLEGMRQFPFALLPMPRGAYQTVIEGPATRLAQTKRKFEIDPGLTQALLDDIEKGGGGDALPLLAFTLGQLFHDCKGVGKLTRADYEKLHGLAGAIDAAIKRVFASADADPRIPKDFYARLALLRRGLIPWLAGVDPDTKTPRRRVARTGQIPEEARPLIDLLVAERMLTRDVDKQSGETTLEPAHESLLRQWGSLKGWLEEDFGELARLEGVKRASRDWDANARDKAWAAHGGGRLEEADRLDARPDLAALLDATDRAYLAACREKEKKAKDAEEEQRRAEAALAQERADKLTERARNSRRLAIVTSAGLVVALALSVFAGLQWRNANLQRGRAESALKLATGTANSLIFDLAQKLRDVSGVPASVVADILGRARKLQEQLNAGGSAGTDLQRSQAAALAETTLSLMTMGDLKGALDVARQAQSYMERLAHSDPGNPEWQRDLSVSYERVGDVQRAQGDLKAALRSYADSRAIFERLAKSDPGDSRWQRGLSISYERVGDVQRAQGDLNAALQSYVDSRAIGERLVKSDPGNARWQRGLSVSYEKIGDLQAAQGDLAAALTSHINRHEIISRLAKSDPGNAEWQRDLSVSYEKVGDVQMAQGDLKAALQSYAHDRAIAERLAKSDPGNAGWQRDLSASYEKAGNVQVALGDLKAALQFYADSHAIRERLAKSDPGNAEWQRDSSVSYNKIGDVQAAQGDLKLALQSYVDSRAIGERLVKTDPGNARWQRDLSLSYNKIGDVQAAQGDLKLALQSYVDSRALRERLAKSDPSNAGWQRDLSVSYNKIGDAQAAQGDLKAALQSYADSHAIFERLAKSDPGNAGWQRDLSVSYGKLADVHLKSGEKAQAREALNAGRAIIMGLLKNHPDWAQWKNDLLRFDGLLADLDKSASARETEPLAKESKQTKRKR